MTGLTVYFSYNYRKDSIDYLTYYKTPYFSVIISQKLSHIGKSTEVSVVGVQDSTVHPLTEDERDNRVQSM